MGVKLDFLLCPSDNGAGDPGWTGGCAYRANLGTERWYFSLDGPFSGGLASTSPSSITDGFSNTAGFSEKLRGRVADTRVNLRTDMIVGALGFGFTIEQCRIHCASLTSPDQGFFTSAGLTWFTGNLPQTSYNHIITPNSINFDCVFPLSHPIDGLFGARSNHAGGVHVAMMDGSVRYMLNSIERSVWISLGSRAGGVVYSN
jgi:prepilin-type processing-associated H-X9-DG protein